jgi:hypothetical protein
MHQFKHEEGTNRSSSPRPRADREDAVQINGFLARVLRVWQKQVRKSEELLCRAEAAQRLQGCRRVRGHRVAAHPGGDAGLPFL